MSELPLPTPSAGTLLRPGKTPEKVYTAEQIREYAAIVAAAQRQWSGLTGAEREQIYQEHYPDSLATAITAVENKLKEKNT